MSLRDVKGPFFGQYGGRYMPESLIAAIDELTAVYESAIVDPAFQAEFAELLGDLGWTVEADGRRIDVIVREV